MGLWYSVDGVMSLCWWGQLTLLMGSYNCDDGFVLLC